MPDERYKAVLVFANLLLLFVAAQLLGFYTGNFIIDDAQHNEVVQGLRVISEPSGAEGVFYLFFYVLVGALIMYLLVRFYKGDLLFILLEFAVISFASSIVFYSFIRLAFPELTAMVLAVALGLSLGFLKAALPRLRNFAAVLATAGAGAVFGLSLGFYQALIFLFLLSVYDYIAVFKTKHMVAMAENLSKRQASFLVSSTQQTARGEMKLELGTGDMLIPVILEVSGYKIGPAYAGIAFAASVSALFVLFILLAKKKAVLPALPIIAGCNIVFFGVSKLLGII